MLVFLHIENIAVVKRVDIDFTDGFTVLTGETGAGKSIIIDSIELLLGARSSKDLVRTGEDFARVNGLFSYIDAEGLAKLAEYDIEPDEDGTISVTRTLYADGRSQIKINSRTTQVSVLKELAPHLVNIHSQHESNELFDVSAHIKYLDAYAEKAEGFVDLRSEYHECYLKARETRRKLESLKKNDSDKERMRDLLEYQIKEIDAASLKANEDTELKSRLSILQNAEKLTKGCDFVYRALAKNNSGLCAFDLVDKAQTALKKLSEYIPDAEECYEKLENLKYELADIGERIYDFSPDGISDITGELDKIQSRLEMISRLSRKYGPSVDDIITFREKAAVSLDEIENNKELTEKLSVKYEKEASVLREVALRLHKERLSAAEKFSDAIVKSLDFLDMKGARFEIRVALSDDVSDYGTSGADTVEFMMAANPGEALKPMSKTASGGELSRVMLALKSELAGRAGAQSVIFDEIDTGVSGKTGEKIGRMLKNISKQLQVFSITHSAQIAALADTHLFISKKEVDGRAETFVKELDFEERVTECARITGGVSISEKQLEAAREMLVLAKASK